MRTCTSLAVSFLFLVAASARAADLEVGPVGSGAAFTSIRAAVATANAGDRVLVRAGVYSEYVVVSKPIELLGAGSSSTVIRPAPVNAPLPVLFAPLGLSGIGAGERAVVRGFRLEVPSLLRVLQYPYTMAYALDCAGRVELSDLHLAAGNLYTAGAGTGGLVLVRDCAQVLMDGVKALGAALPVSNGTEGISGLFVERSRAWVSRCEFGGSSAGTRSSGATGEAGSGLRAIDSEIQLARTRLVGGGGAARSTALAEPGGSGLEARGSSIVVHGGDGATIVGADARETIYLLITLFNAGGHAVELDATSALTLAPDVRLAAGAPSANLPGGQPISAASGASLRTLPERAPSLAFLPQIGVLGSTSTVQYEGEPGSIHARFLSFASGDALALPGIEGTLLLDLLSFYYVETVTIGVLGAATSGAPIPPEPLLAGLGIVEQTLQWTPLALRFAPPALKSIGF